MNDINAHRKPRERVIHNRAGITVKAVSRVETLDLSRGITINSPRDSRPVTVRPLIVAEWAEKHRGT